MRTNTATQITSKKQAIDFFFAESRYFFGKIDRRKTIVKQALSFVSVEELRDIQEKRIGRYRPTPKPYEPIVELRGLIEWQKNCIGTPYLKILIEGNKHIYWASPTYGHADYNRTIWADNTPANRKRMQLINKMLGC